jgi:hypothetical protein
MVYGAQNMVHGVQNMVYGAQNMVHGVQNMVYGLRCRVYGLQSTVYRHGAGKEGAPCKELRKGVSTNYVLEEVPCGVQRMWHFLKPVKSLNAILN